MVVGVLLDDAEDSRGRLPPPLAARHGRAQNPALRVIDGDALLLQGDDRQDRIAGIARFVGLDGALARAAPGVGRKLRADPERQGGNGKAGRQEPLAPLPRQQKRHARTIENRGHDLSCPKD